MTHKLGKNPWISILVKPKATIREIVDFNPNHRLLFLAAFIGFFSLLEIAQQLNIGEKLSFFSILVPAVILAPLWGYICFSVGSWFVFFTGKWIKGKGTFKQIRAAVAWSNVPFIANLLVWIVFLYLYRNTLFQEMEPLKAGALAISLVTLQAVTAIWSFVIYINALAEVQQFSRWRAFFNIILSSIFGLAVMLFIVFFSLLIVKWTCSAFFEEPTLVFLSLFQFLDFL